MKARHPIRFNRVEIKIGEESAFWNRKSSGKERCHRKETGGTLYLRRAPERKIYKRKRKLGVSPTHHPTWNEAGGCFSRS